MDSQTTSLNPGEIPLNFTISGQVLQLPFAALDAYQHETVGKAIINGCTIGSCGLLTLVLLMLNVRKKKTPIFYLNTATLVTAIIRSSLYLAYVLGPLSSPSFQFTGLVEEKSIGSSRTNIAANAFQVILIFLIECSMTYQIFIIFRSPEVRVLGYILTAAIGALGCTVVGFYINSAVASAKIYRSIYAGEPVPLLAQQRWITSVPTTLFAASVNILSILLVLKLAFAIRTRRFLGLKQFGSFHILLIMATQTFVVPSVIMIVQYRYLQLSTSTLITVANLFVILSLPLSSTWASTANNEPTLPAQYSFVRSNSKMSDSSGDCGRTLTSYSFLPDKLMRSSTKRSSTSEKTAIPQSPGSTRSELPPDIEELINGDYTQDEFNKNVHYLTIGTPTDSSHLSQNSQKSVLGSDIHDDFVAVTKHNVKEEVDN